MLRVLTRVVADAAVVAIVLFVAAGTLAWQRAWILVAVLLCVRIVSAIAVYRVNVGLGSWLGSYAAVLFAAIPLALLIVRIRLEEQFLRRDLPGYGEYAARVPYRLLPGLW